MAKKRKQKTCSFCYEKPTHKWNLSKTATLCEFHYAAAMEAVLRQREWEAQTGIKYD